MSFKLVSFFTFIINKNPQSTSGAVSYSNSKKSLKSI